MATRVRSRTAASAPTASVPTTTTASGGRIAASGRRAARRSLAGLARIIRLITAGVAGVILIGIALVLLEGNRDNMIVDGLLDAAAWLTAPFEDMFTLDDRKQSIAVNYGIAAAVSALAGGLLARFVRPR
jgi:hypothetical protein